MGLGIGDQHFYSSQIVDSKWKLHQLVDPCLPCLLFLGSIDCLCCFSKVHMPLGPRKSGIPAVVLIPAPVTMTKCEDFSAHLDSIFNFVCTTRLVSKFSKEIHC